MDDSELVDAGFDIYQEYASETAIYPRQIKIMYPCMGLAGEVGEVLNKIKKHYRDGTSLNREEIGKELGDVLWYVSALASDLGVSLGWCATQNLQKLKDRQERDALGGSGDDR